MSGTSPGFRGVLETAPDEKEHRRQLARGINSALQGKLNATLTVTLTANSATTTLTDARITNNSFIDFMPQTANAAAARAGMYITTRTAMNGTVLGTAVINHANNAQVDKTFTALIIG